MSLLGKKVKDTISGLQGVAVARTEFINGCIQYEVQPKATKEGRLPESVGMDEQNLEEITTKKKATKKKTKRKGGKNNSSINMRGW